uniref:ABC transporter domain-containing protein n=1 Tax=viral metagenome TaxID=1070528 RepID=A0A6C0DYZ0_9ZZZZ
MSEVAININKILLRSIMNNKILLLSIIPLFFGYYLQDNIFIRMLSKVTSNIPEFIKDINLSKLFILLLPYLLAVVLFYISNIISASTMPKIELEAVTNLLDKIIQSIQTTKKQINVNDLVLHIKKIAGTKNVYRIIVTYIIPTFVLSMALIYNFLKNNTKYGLLVIFMLVFLMLMTIKVEYDNLGDAYKAEESVNDLYDEIHEIMTNLDTVVTSNTKEKEMKNIKLARNTTHSLFVHGEVTNNTSTYGLQLLSIGIVLSMNYMAYRLYTQNKIDTPVFVSIALTSTLLMDYYNYCIHAVGELIMNLGRHVEAVSYFSDFKIKKNNDVNKHKKLVINDAYIKFENINLTYGDKVIFKNFNLAIEGNKKTGIRGNMGCGKSTLLKMLAGIIDFKGKIYIDKQDISKHNCTEKLAYISQHPKLFDNTVLYNLNYGSNLSQREIEKKIDEMKLTTFFNSLPNKLETKVGKEGANLSGGQKQYVALMRALIQNKQILLLDEPTSSLDTSSKTIFMDVIRSITNKTIIISTHDQELVPIFDTVIKLEEEKKKNVST